MSALLNASPKVGGAVSFVDGIVPPAHFANGLPYEGDARLAVDVDGTIAHYHQGLGFSAAGRLVVTLTGPPTRIGNGAAPFDSVGRLVLSIGAVTHYANGVPYTADSSVNGTLTAPSFGPLPNGPFPTVEQTYFPEPVGGSDATMRYQWNLDGQDDFWSRGNPDYGQTVNKTLLILKSRGGIGTGYRLGFDFDKDTLRFMEKGIIKPKA